MHDLLTPKQVANAIDVSESSVKRWCDKGVIPTQYTAGGHRRIALAGLLEFLRRQQCQVVRPELLGLPSNTGRTNRVIDRATQQLTEALISGHEEESRRLVWDLYLAEHSISKICDAVIAPAFQTIGSLWECGAAEVFQERRGCEIALNILRELRSVTPIPAGDAPKAIGGASEGDQYSLATAMAEIVLRDAKWNAVSLGDNLPMATLGEAIKTHRPRLFWLSCSHLGDEDQFLNEYTQLFDEFGMDVAFVVGGRALTERLRKRMNYAAFCDNMQHLQSFAQAMVSA